MKRASRISKGKQSTSQKTLFDHFSRPNKPVESVQDVKNGVNPDNQVPAAPAEPHPEVSSADSASASLPASSQDALLSTQLHPHTPVAELASAEVIDITDDDPVAGPSKIQALKPKPLARRASRRANHSADPGPPSPPLPTPPTNGSTRDEPIVLVDSSPMKPSAVSTRPAPTQVYSIFATSRPADRRSATPAATSLSFARRKASQAPLPDAEAQHVRGPQSSFTAPPLAIDRREPRLAVQEEPASASLTYLHADFSGPRNSDEPPCTADPTTHVSALPDRTACLNDILNFVWHPSISRLRDSVVNATYETPTSNSQHAWVDKHRPLRADEVLGNSHRALYLRNWLQALELQYDSPTHTDPSSVAGPKQKGKPKAKEKRGVKRPRVIRHVEKQRGRKKMRFDSDEEESWIVSDEDDGNMDLPSGSEDEEEYCRRIYARLNPGGGDPAQLNGSKNPALPQDVPPVAPVAPNNPAFDVVFAELSNTILLTGPPGCGKTAAVYACAAELGWEVFEVYPGIGKRGGSSLNDLVGEVGKSHLVQKQKAKATEEATGKAKDVFAKFLDKGRKGVSGGAKGLHRRGTEEEPIELAEEATTGETPRISADHTKPQEHPSIRQSIILLEEVDIVFKDDVNFWPSVVSLIKDCRRPVVMTCNDITLVPIDDLPLQNVLTFEPCPSPLAASYLQGMCAAEGSFPDRDALVRLYETTAQLHTIDLPDVPLHPHTETLPKPDLRRAIHQLQLWCSNRGHAIGYDTTDDRSLEDMAEWGTHPNVKAPGAADRDLSIRALDRLAAHTELASFVDRHLVRRPLDAPEALATLYSFETSPDDEIGHPILFASYKDDDIRADDACPKPGISSLDHEPRGAEVMLTETLKADARVFCHRDKSIAQAAMRHSRGILDAPSRAGETSRKLPSLLPDARALFRARVEYQSRMLQVLDTALVPLSGPLMPRPALYLEYVPWIRHMVHTDDVLDEAARSGNHGEAAVEGNDSRKRRTRNSRRTEYVRQISLTDEQRSALDSTKLTSFD
ncbi:hypothetical protein PLICRDRAFT_34020 [Plicaturopsis crispa FD-325 SS-3]|nr:hypothetical protein PLICRDRAFT_34020 [Plicaturopsis crispa FD-325 SS-3]